MKLDVIRNGGKGAKTEFLCALIGAVTFVAYTIYGLVFDYLDYMVEITLIMGILCALADLVLDQKALGILNLVSAMLISYAFGLFAVNTFPVWADNVNGITMYASRGGLIPVVLLIILYLFTLILEICSCFTSKEGK